MLKKLDTRVDEEIYNNLSSKSYFIGLILLYLSNSQKELASKVKTVILEMKNMLKDTNFKNHVDLLTYEGFIKMELDSEYDKFNQMYDEYAKLREARLRELSDREREEERKRLEREEKERELGEQEGNSLSNLIYIDSQDIIVDDNGIALVWFLAFNLV